MTQILGIAGSLRAASSSKAVLRTVLDSLPKGVPQATADIGTIPHYNADHDGGAATADFVAQITNADGLIFVTPEYNYSIPGVLKNAIDWASRPAYASVFVDKPCLIISVSAGALGGVRAQAHLKYILNGMLARVHPGQEIVVPHAPKKLVDGQFSDPDFLAFIAPQIADFCDRCAT
ncbi:MULTISPECIES: NAD(P)H-dependent oxidoreductase [unclassified Yoonia]|uniref:NADPH-dependent FMN reductase n=1 Tax=unclassified Yoonia TaxID=2629118 RepID=UPI002AFFC33D|nr:MULTISPECIES: NAD(P)H-dependent oxidoreductase [unclassified Yoonia]